MTRKMALTLLATLPFLAGRPAVAQSDAPILVGVAAAVNASTEEFRPSYERRTLQVGTDIEQNERIETDENGQAQLLFVDGSSFTVGSSSSVVVDDFVYDPAVRKGHLGLSLGKGVFRFVGGHLSKDGSVEVRTPTALLGIRGAIVLIEIDPEDGKTSVTLLYGDHVTISGFDGSYEVIRRMGYGSVIGRDRAPTSPRRIDPARLGTLEARFERPPAKAHPDSPILHGRLKDTASPTVDTSLMRIGLTPLLTLGEAGSVAATTAGFSAVTISDSSPFSPFTSIVFVPDGPGMATSGLPLPQSTIPLTSIGSASATAVPSAHLVKR